MRRKCEPRCAAFSCRENKTGAKDAGSKTGPDYLVLVNKEHRISPDYARTIELVSEPGYDNEIFWVEKRTLESFRELRETVKKMDMDITLSSGYRSVERQEEIRKEFLEEYGEEYVHKFVAQPGTSEHHTGLAVDFVARIGGKWLIENSDIREREAELFPIYAVLPKFGFILRYLRGKEEITGYPAEPWHLRYVRDPEVAREIMERGITLEEYLQNRAADR